MMKDYLGIYLMIIFAIMAILRVSKAINPREIKEISAKYNVTCILVFGDSSVDSGNNNFISTNMKGNFIPYGKDFFDAKPTGRFSNGKLATDFIAATLGYTKALPAFLDPTITKNDILHGVSFASAGSGYDDLTANFSNVLSFSKQVEYLRHYKIHLMKLVGKLEAVKRISKTVFVLSMGSNDFLQNYYLEPNRSLQYTVEQYINYLSSRMFEDIKMLHVEGARKLIVVGVPPLGCTPLVKTLKDEKKCVEDYNKICNSLNSKIKQNLNILTATTGTKTSYIDAYGIIINVINNPTKYGINETSKGCCGSGTTEFGDTCKGLRTCGDASKYVFWDAVHPSQKMYQIIADDAIASINPLFFT